MQQELQERCAVLVATAVEPVFDYALPPGVAVRPGTYVTVPFGKKELPGVVWGAAQSNLPLQKLKAILQLHDLPPMPDVQRRFIDWVADYTLNPRGAVLKMALSVPKALALPPPGGGKKRVALGVGGQVFKEKPAQVLIHYARDMRRNPTDVEKKIWFLLNHEQMGCKFRRQHPIGRYIVDFVCLEKKLIVELDGGQHNESKHDERRDAFFKTE
ncbi:MAG: DUF559 domain-containing protein, partial [Alphaproteobacteria bacterium]|nr:DUF559 domain-containing protein [Alphaproteobacteria bacterium]